MKRMHKIAVLALAVVMVLGTMVVFADYDYTMTVSAGRGSITLPADKITSAEALTTDPTKNIVKINGKEVTVTPPDADHFVIGLKDAGHDNGALLAANKEVKLADRNEDTELVVAYGLKSDMVEYTINYVEAGTGNVLLPAETHYGVDGSKPVVSYKYVENYLPDAYNRTGTLVRGGANTFTFYYYEVDAEGNVITVVNNVAGGGAGAAGAGAAGAGGAGAAAAGGANIADGAVPLDGGQPNDVVDIDDGGTPTTDNPDGQGGEGDGTDIDDGTTPGAGGNGINWPAVGGGVGAVALIAAIAALLAKRKKDAEEDDDDDEEDAE